MKDVLEYPNMPWDWGWLSKNPSITMKDIIAHPDKPWEWTELSANPRIFIEDVKMPSE